MAQHAGPRTRHGRFIEGTGLVLMALLAVGASAGLGLGLRQLGLPLWAAWVVGVGYVITTAGITAYLTLPQKKPGVSEISFDQPVEEKVSGEPH